MIASHFLNKTFSMLKPVNLYVIQSKQTLRFSTKMRVFDSVFGLALAMGMCSCYTIQESPIVTVKQGKLKGRVNKTLEGAPYYSFRGIPYAQPPIGELRFKAPLPPKPWQGIRDATAHGEICPQYDMSTTELSEGSEDCLFLNVYTKSIQSDSKTPVMVYIHGGAFMSGSGDSDTYGPEYLFLHDVILVTLNYRLEALGFLCLDIPEVPGNAGMKDQVLALRWVKENIRKFGGDPDNVTIFGESAGASSVTYHMLSPMSKGLFHKAIAQSGVSIADWSIAYEPKQRALRSGKALGKDTKDVKELLKFLRSVPAIDLAKLTFKTRTQDEKRRGLPMHFVPNIEKQFDGVEAFFTENPIDMLLAGKVNKVPLLIGYNSAEGLLMVEDNIKKADDYNAIPSYYVPRELALKLSKDKLEEFGQRIKRFYFGDKGISNETAQAMAALQTDLHFSYQTRRFMHFYNTLAPTYMYRFDYETDLNILKRFLAPPYTKLKGACHADDLFYLFSNELNKELYAEQEKLQKILFDLTKFWVDFAWTGNPTPNKGDLQWHPYTSVNKDCIILNERITPRKNPDGERIDFWNKLYCEAGVPSINKSSL